jgi:hypothetical protein
MTTVRVTVFEASFHTDCESAQIATIFDNKKNLRLLKPESDLDQVLATNLKIFEMGKLLESNSKFNTLRQPLGCGSGGRAFTRVGTVTRGGGVRGVALSTRADPEQSCLWCAKKGHTIFDYPSSPTPVLKKVRDDLLAKRAAKGRNETRKAPRLVSVTTSAIVNDDESEITEGEEITLGQGTLLIFRFFSQLMKLQNLLVFVFCLRIL